MLYNSFDHLFYITQHYLHMLVKIKEILTKMYFHMPSKLLVPFYTTLTQYTDFFLVQIESIYQSL